MSEKTLIAWTDHTWSPWEGCEKVSPGCKNCYAEALNHRWGKDNWGPGKPRRLTKDWTKPRRWHLQEERKQDCIDMHGSGPVETSRVFPSMCDPFDTAVPYEWRSDFLNLIGETPALTWLLLTKRPAEAKKFIEEQGRLPENVWLGVSAEDQKRANERTPILLSISAAVRFLSVEPMLEGIELPIPHRDRPGSSVDWVIFGGESGPNARPCNVEWIRDGVRQCRDVSVPVFVKQLGSKPVQDLSAAIPEANDQSEPDDIAAWEYHRHNHLIQLNHPKGGDPSEWSEDLRVREFPTV